MRTGGDAPPAPRPRWEPPALRRQPGTGDGGPTDVGQDTAELPQARADAPPTRLRAAPTGPAPRRASAPPTTPPAAPPAPPAWDEPVVAPGEAETDRGFGRPLALSPTGKPGRARRRQRPTTRPAEPEAPGTVDRGPRLPYVPAFDGLRAVALLAVLAFHQGYDLASGGFLGVSSFFTLSGFLLATLLLAEWSQGSRVSLPRFWEGRARRLIPPVVVTLAGVVALQVALRVGAGPRFRGDVLAAAGQVLNWRFALDGDGFASILTNPSPVQHFWSVSMAVQVLLVFPLAFVVLMRLTGRRWRAAGTVFALAAAGSFVAAALTAERTGNDGLAYYGTHTRLGEMLVGVALAFAVLSPAVRRLMERPAAAAVLRLGPLVALGGLAWLWATTSLYSGSLFRGVTAANAVLTAFIVLAVTGPTPVARVLGWAPLRLIGKVSLAAYLAHWPLYLLLDADRTGLDSHALFLLRVGLTLAVAVVSTWAFEWPLRYRLAVPRLQLGLGLGTSLAVVAAAALVLPEQPPPDVSLTIDDGSDPGDLEAVVPAAGGDELVRIAVVGDGLAASMVRGLAAWNADHPEGQVRVDTHVAAGCPVSAPGPVRLAGAEVGDGVACVGFAPRLPRLLERSEPDAIVVVGGLADLGEREIDRQWRHLGDPVFDDWLADRYDDLAATLAAQDVPVLWATHPHVRLGPGNEGEGDWTAVPDNDPLRVERLNEIISDTVTGWDDFSVIDLDAWTQDLPGGGAFNAEFRLEGRDLTEEGAARAAGWLVPRVLDATGTELPEDDTADTDDGGGDSDTDDGGDGT